MEFVSNIPFRFNRLWFDDFIFDLISNPIQRFSREISETKTNRLFFLLNKVVGAYIESKLTRLINKTIYTNTVQHVIYQSVDPCQYRQH